jgi:predicted kinase
MIILVGVPGSGKTFFAEKFADTFGAPYVSRDKITEFLPETKQANTEAIALHQLGELLKTKQSIVVDGLATTRTSRIELGRTARAAGYETMLVWIQTDQATAKSRAIKASKKQLSPDDYDKLAGQFTPPNALEKPIVVSGKHTYASQAKVVLKKLTEPRAEISTHTTAPVRQQPSGRRNITIR